MKPRYVFNAFSALVVTLALTFMGATGAMALNGEEPVVCSEKTYPLTAGQTIPVGTVKVSSDGTNLKVTYETFGDWYLTEAQLYVLDSEPTTRLPPGQAPYKSGDLAPAVQSYTFQVPLPDFLKCNSTVWLQAHASVVKIVDGSVLQGETAYGGDITDPEQGSWYGNIKFTCDCGGEEPCWEGETAWADGTRYVNRGNWATYTPYYGADSVTLYAGQTMEAGTVSFSAAADGMVTITITLNEGWRFAEVDENVKIQAYASAPSGNPSPGLFAHKFTAASSPAGFVVPQNNFYGVHVDVEREVDCEPDLE